MPSSIPPLPGTTPSFPDRRRTETPNSSLRARPSLPPHLTAAASIPPPTPPSPANPLPPPPSSTTSSPSVPTTQSPTASRDANFTPLPWNTCFDESYDIPLPSRHGVWRLYTANLPLHEGAPPPLVVVFLHGGGHSALSWGLVSSTLKKHVPVFAFDARGHGHSLADDDTLLDAQSQMADASTLLTTFFRQHWPSHSLPKLVLCGHSMGGAIAVRLAAARDVLPSVVGLVVIDVVEGTAMAALPHMSGWLADRSPSFPSLQKAIRYVTRSGFVRNTRSARLSVPPQLQYSQSDDCWIWRTPLDETEQYWKGWFDGLSALFLSVPAAKLLVLANVNRLDKDLMIAQMQGKFQNILIPSAGHTIHEDQPEKTARALLDYLNRNMLIEHNDDDEQATIFQQRRPIPPCC